MIEVELKPRATQGELVAATLKNEAATMEAAESDLNALLLFRNDMGAFLPLYTFLSQIFDYGNTDIEKRSIFYKRLLPLLGFGRERGSGHI